MQPFRFRMLTEPELDGIMQKYHWNIALGDQDYITILGFEVRVRTMSRNLEEESDIHLHNRTLVDGAMGYKKTRQNTLGIQKLLYLCIIQ
jgi:hypothetical protein